jgi:hypothetical protein
MFHGAARGSQRSRTHEVRIKRPSSLGLLDALLTQGIVRIDLSSGRGNDGIGLVVSTEADDAERSIDAFVKSCEKAGLEIASPQPSGDATQEEDDLWEVRGW